MDRENFNKAILNDEDSTIVEHAITKDGIQNYSWHSESAYGGGGETNVDVEKIKIKENPFMVYGVKIANISQFLK